MLSLLAIPKGLLLAASCAVMVFLNNVSPREYTKEDISAIEERVFERIEQMREVTDDQWGEGVFDMIADGKLTQEELDKLGAKIKE
jgi:hypothetical protein